MRVLHFPGRLAPDVDGALVALVLGDEAHLELLEEFVDLASALLQQVGLVLRHLDLVDGDGDAAARGVVEARCS